jgi:hypothetical protein
MFESQRIVQQAVTTYDSHTLREGEDPAEPDRPQVGVRRRHQGKL